MNKKLLFVLVCLVTSYSLKAQYLSGTDFSGMDPVTPKSTVLKYAVKAGVNFTTVSPGKVEVESAMSTGFHVGAALNLRWGYRTATSRPGTGLVGFQPEIMFSYQAVKLDDEVMEMQKVYIPLMLKLYPVSSLYVEIGPELSYLINTSPDKISISSSTLNVGECSGFATDLAIGFGYEAKFGLTVGARYDFGVTALAKNLPWRTHNIAVSVGWMF